MARTLTIGRAIAATMLVLAALHPGTEIARAQDTPDLSVGGYELLNRVRTGRTAFDYTFRGVLSNRGTRNTIGPATATLTSLSPSTLVVDGTLGFPVVPAGGSASSSDTFTIRIDRLLPFDASHLSWSISAEFEEPTPTIEAPWGSAFCAPQATCVFDAFGGTCEGCRVALAFGVELNCPLGSTCTVSGQNASTVGGEVRGPGGTLDCAGAVCSVGPETVMCSGEFGECGITDGFNSCPNPGCVSMLPTSFLREVVPQPRRTTTVVIRKITTTPEAGTFSFRVITTDNTDGTQTELGPLPISASGGVGTNAAVFQFDGQSSFEVQELTPAEWTLDNIVCSINGEPGVIVPFDTTSNVATVGLFGGSSPSRQIECEFRNRRTPPPTTVMVPRVTGFIQSDAIQFITAADLTVGTITHQTSATAFAGIVTGQSPEALAQVAPSTPVNLVVASQRFTFDGWGFVECFDSPCVQSPNGAIATSGRISTPGASVACAPPTGGPACLIRIDDSGVVCTGGPEDCRVTLPSGQTPVDCSGEAACNVVLGKSLLGGTEPFATLVIEKVALSFEGEPLDGEFSFLIAEQLDGSGLQKSIDTQGGRGAATLLFSLEEFGQPINIRELVPGAWDLELLTCGHEGFVSAGGGLGGAPQIVTRAVDEGVVVRCTFTNRRLPPSTVNTTAVHQPEAVTHVPAGAFGLAAAPLVTIAGSLRLDVVNPLTNVVPTAGSTALSLNTQGNGDMYAALVVKHPNIAGSDALFTIGPLRTTSRQFFPDIGRFGLTQVSFPAGENFTDAVHFNGDPDAAGLVVVNNTFNGIGAQVWRDFGGTLFFSGAASSLGSGLNFPGASGRVVSAFGFGLAFDTDGRLVRSGSPSLLVVTDGTPGQLWSHDPTTGFAPATLIGTVGDSPRRIRCLPTHDLCAVSNFASDSITLFDVSDPRNPVRLNALDVGDGPVGIDLTADGPNLKVISTGFNDNSFTISVVAADGTVVSLDTEPVPVGCLNPGHALWLAGRPGSAVITCNGSDAYAVVNR